MKKEEKLKKIIEKARNIQLTGPIEFIDNNTIKLYGGIEIINLYELIFSSEFGKAYFGENEYCSVCETSGHEPCDYYAEYKIAWIYHQHQLLTEIQEERDVIDYLYKFID